MVTITLKGDRTFLNELEMFNADIRKYGRKVAKQSAVVGIKHLKNEAPTATGDLKQKITRIPLNNGWVQQISMPIKGIYVSEGTKPHFIPNNLRTRTYAGLYGMRFSNFKKAIAEKGTRPSNFIQIAFHRTNSKIDRILVKELDKTIRLLRKR